MIFHEICWTFLLHVPRFQVMKKPSGVATAATELSGGEIDFPSAKKLTSLASFRERNILQLYACRKDYGFIFASRPASWDADTPNTESCGRLIRPVCIVLDEQNCYSPIRKSSIKTWIFSSAFFEHQNNWPFFFVGVWIQSLKGFMGIC